MLEHVASHGPSIYPRRNSTARALRLADPEIGSTYRHRCTGRAVFRSPRARDLALVLDLDPAIASWRCLPGQVPGRVGHDRFVSIEPDVLVEMRDGTRVVVDADGLEDFVPLDPALTYVDAEAAGLLDDARIANAHGIMAYANFVVPLAAQVRLLGCLEEGGPTTLLEACAAVRTGDPIAAVMALAARRVVHVEWREGTIGPRSLVEIWPGRPIASADASRLEIVP